MRKEFDPYKAGLTACALLAAYALKSHYSGASAEELRWILAPTTVLVERFNGSNFEFEAAAGYISKERFFLIAPACSGVNFLMTSFLMLSLKWIWTLPSRKAQLLSLPLAAGIAFVATLFTNSIRITLAMAFQGLQSTSLHRIEGIVIYFGSLLLLYGPQASRLHYGPQASRLHYGPQASRLHYGPQASRLHYGSQASRLHKLLPLLIYYACALGIPLANGAFQQGFPFWEHSLFVLIIPLGMFLILQLLSLPGKFVQTFPASKVR